MTVYSLISGGGKHRGERGRKVGRGEGLNTDDLLYKSALWHRDILRKVLKDLGVAVTFSGALIQCFDAVFLELISRGGLFLSLYSHMKERVYHSSLNKHGH